MGSIRGKAHILPDTHTFGNGQHTSGAMERYAWVRYIRGKAHHLPKRTWSNCQYFSGAMECYTWVRFAGKLTGCQTMHIAMVSISVGQWITVQGRFKVQAPTPNCAHTRQHTVKFSGAMEEISRQGQKVSAHWLRDSSTRWCWSVLPCHRCGVPRPASQKPSA